MSGGFLGNAGTFLISVFFGAYILLVMLRFIMQWQRADFYNPMSQFIVKITNPPLIPLRKLIPGFAGLDFAAVLLMLVLQFIELGLIAYISLGHIPNLLGLLIWSLGELINLFLMVYIVGMIILAIVSWVSPQGHSPVLSLVHQIIDPLLFQFRKVIPPMSGLDLSVFFALIVLFLIKMFNDYTIIFQGQQLIKSTAIF